ncbi:MAG: bifunctional pyr operon transcriptional regulator/uracil phosphoribosyltransferase PyrR [Bacteroidia bacterium]|nr:bifunctional pyr operon transcriptional regulator/uracil phosphoribosyltransferase PyrR [Bacteroidia bacterium]
MKPRLILDSEQFQITIDRLCHQLIEVHDDFRETVIIAIQPRGILLGRRIRTRLQQLLKKKHIFYGELDITFHRDDFRKRSLVPSATDIPFTIEEKNVILIDDVLFTGRTIRAALDAMLDFGRPKDVELMVLIDRRFSRNVPIQAKYVGKTIDSISSERVTVEWKETDKKDQVILAATETKAKKKNG